jgi:hypothetical protein
MMKRIGLLAFLLVALTARPSWAQATHITTGGTLPANCTVGDVYVKTGATAGFYRCSATDTWTALLSSGGDAGTPSAIVLTNATLFPFATGGTGIVPPANLGTGSSITTKYLRGDGTWQTLAGGGDALTTGDLSQFAATTSAQLFGVLSDETGSGASALAVFNRAPLIYNGVLTTATDAMSFVVRRNGAAQTANVIEFQTEANAFLSGFNATGDFLSGADPADAGVIRLPNAAVIGWEASPAGTDVTLTVNSSEQFVFSAAILSPTFVTPALGTPSSGVATNLTGAPTFTSLAVDTEVYDATGWNGDLTVPTKDAVRDIIETFLTISGTPAQGDIIYYNGSAWTLLVAGTSGKYLKTQGAAANPMWDTPAGSGTVTATGGALTPNAVVLGAGTTDTKVVTGVTTDGASGLNLGVSATTQGTLKLFGGTSGYTTLVSGAAAGTSALTLPIATDTLVGKATTDTFTNKTFDTKGTGNVFKDVLFYEWRAGLSQGATASLGVFLPTTNPCASATIGTGDAVETGCAFDAATDEALRLDFTVHPDYDNTGSVDVIIEGYFVSATTGEACMCVNTTAITTGAMGSMTFNDPFCGNLTATGTAGDRHTLTLTGIDVDDWAASAAGKMWVKRNADAGDEGQAAFTEDDDAAGDFVITSIRVIWRVSK